MRGIESARTIILGTKYATRILSYVLLGSMMANLCLATDLYAERTEAQLIEDLGSKNSGARQAAKEEFLAKGTKSIPTLMKVLDESDPIKKTTAIMILGELKAAEAVPRLIEESKSQNILIAANSAFALGLSGDSRALPSLSAMLDPANDAAVRGAALVALGYLKNPEAIPHVRELLADQNQTIRILAAAALGMLGSNDGLQEALAGTTHKNDAVVITSIQALGMIGDKQAIPRLEEMTRDQKAWSSDILLSLKQIEYASSLPGSKIEILRASINDKSPKIVEWAIWTLANVATPEAVLLLEEKAKAGNSKEASMARAKLGTIRR
jgi:HEAT repeat protein